MPNFYEELGVASTATQEEISKAYKTLARKYHPDLFVGDKEVGRAKMATINEAYATLSDAEKRGAYDKKNDINQAADNFYEELGVDPKATAEEIAAAYKTLARKYHPDLYQGDKTVGAYKMSLINNAYGTLSDKEKREKYDRKLSGNYSVEKPKKKFPLIAVIAASLAVIITAVILIVYFTRPDDMPGYTIIYAPQDDGLCTLSSSAAVNIDGEVVQIIKSDSMGKAVTVTPAQGYAFLMWSDGKIANPRVDQGRDLSAEPQTVYAICTPAHTVELGVEAFGSTTYGTVVITISVQGKTTATISLPTAINYVWEGSVAEGATIKIVATPKAGYEFDCWSDGWTDESDDASATRIQTVSELSSTISAVAKFKLKED